MSECITLHVGQAGIQMGQSFWELFCKEHQINIDGKNKDKQNDNTVNTFFYSSSKDVNVPRSLFIDSDQQIIDEIKSGSQKDLYHPNQLIGLEGGSSSIFTRGYQISEEQVEKCTEEIRRLTEKCNQLSGFLIQHSVSGGTGSGLTCKLLQKLDDEYKKRSKLNFIVYLNNGGISSNTLELYNTILSSSALIEHSDVCVLYDNLCLYDFITKKLDIESPDYSNLNRYIAQTISSLTASFRYDGYLNVDLSEFQTNLVPYPNMHFMPCSYTPLIPQGTQPSPISVADLTHQIFDPQNLTLNIDPREGKYIAACLLYRGDVVPKDVNAAIANIKSKTTIKFVDWCPTGFKVGINSQPPSEDADIIKYKRAACLISNTTSIEKVFDDIYDSFYKQFNRRAFVHSYTNEGEDEEQFTSHAQQLKQIMKQLDEAEDDNELIEQVDEGRQNDETFNEEDIGLLFQEDEI